MDDADRAFQARQFERHRARLRAVAYRMLGSLSDADDAVQEAWLRLDRADGDAIDNIAAWLTTVTARVCVDMLRARTARREQQLDGRLPEPVVSAEDADDPEQQALIADSVGLALMVVLDTLAPAERLAFVLHDLFGVPYEQIGPVVDRSTDAARKLASRARQRVRGMPTTPNPDRAKQREVVAAFLAAARAGDFDALLRLLDPAAVFRIDPGSRPWVGPTLIEGATLVARQSAVQGPQFATACRSATVNGAAGIVAETAVGIIAVAGLTVVGDRITEIDLVLDPRKLERTNARFRTPTRPRADR
jgi:RNA polymerase sigma-70 factor (ECF subfamily)